MSGLLQKRQASMKVLNGLVYKNGSFVEEAVYTNGEYFAAESGDGEVLDAQGCYLIPGLIDIHFHGCAGVDFCEGTEEAVGKLAEYELEHGITTIHPATMTLDEGQLSRIGKAALAFYLAQQERSREQKNRYAELAGIYMEGPFVSLAKKGAQNPAYVKKPDAAFFRRLQAAAGGLYRICTVAPEVPGALEFIDEVKEEVRISAAHTNAGYEEAMQAFSHGARQVTHLFNAMLPFNHREPGVAGAACDREDVMAELICDGIHIHPSVIRAVFKMFGRERIIFISDSMMAAGMPDGTYSLGGQEVCVKGNLAVLAADGTIAGSVTNLFDCMRYAVHTAQIPLADAVCCVTENPAKAIGIANTHGSIADGKYADFILMNQNLEINRIVKKGAVV